ncbi:hypothetical protein GCM10018954_051630 [Kutzneria kofuensis]
MATGTPAEASPYATVTWTERARAGRPVDPATGQCALALVPEDQATALPLVLALQRRGYQVVRVRPGSGFVAGDTEFHVRPGEQADLAAVVAALAATGRSPRLLVHGWALGEWEPVGVDNATAQLDLAFHSLQALVNAAARAAPDTDGRLPGVLVVTNGAVDVSGGEGAHPAKAVLPAHLRTLAAEMPGVACRLLDIAPVGEEDLVDELGAEPDEVVVALRAGRRWVPRELPWQPRPDGTSLRRGGVYLITGGLGGLGVAVAKGLAGTGLRPRLVLAGRSGLPSDEDGTAAAIAEMEALGAQVRVHACDIADARALARMLDITTAHFGPVNGVLHLAGVPGGGMLAVRDRADVQRVCRPKVQGVLALAEAFAGRAPLDFLVSFSSRSALAGMVGNGDYAAANAFLDAYAASRWGRGGERVLSIGWPAWRTVGMAKALVGPSGDEPPAGTRDHLTTLAPDRCWALDEHRVDGRPVLPGTGQLDLVIRAFREVFDLRPDGTVVFEDVTLGQPLAVRREQEVRVRFVEDGDRRRFTVASRAAGSDEPWQDHTSGFVSAPAGAAGSGRTVAVDEVRAALDQQEIPNVVMSSTRMFNLGPRWDSMTGVWAAGSAKLVSLSLPEPFRPDLAVHPLHPALLDLATSIMRDPDQDGLHLPFMYRRFTVHAPLPGVMHSRIHRREGTDRTIVGDIDLIGPDGTVIGEIEGFTMRRADRHSFATRTPATAPEAPPARVAPVPGTGRGLAPEQGVRLLLDLLSARTPAHVLVRPFENDTPVPLARVDAGAAEVASPAQVLAAAAKPSAAPVVPAPVAAVPAPDGESVENRLRELWAEVLGVASFDAGGDFFDLGGDSMSAVQLMGRIRDVFKIEFGIGAVFDHPTVDALARPGARRPCSLKWTVIWCRWTAGGHCGGGTPCAAPACRWSSSTRSPSTGPTTSRRRGRRPPRRCGPRWRTTRSWPR